MYPYHMYSYGFVSPWEIVGHVILAIFFLWILIVVVRMAFGRRHRHWRSRMMWHSDALTILEERYAKGEISKEEFEERRKTLLGE